MTSIPKDMKTLKQITTAAIYANEEVLAAAPRNKVQGELQFFTLGRYVFDDELAKEYESRGLVPADLYALASWEEANKDREDKECIGTHWKDAQGKWCFATFYRWFGERSLRVDRYDYDWHGNCSFVGISTLPILESGSWRKEFDNRFVIAFGGKGSPDEIKDFISNLLSSHRHSLIGEIKKVREMPMADAGFKVALDLVLSRLDK